MDPVSGIKKSFPEGEGSFFIKKLQILRLAYLITCRERHHIHKGFIIPFPSEFNRSIGQCKQRMIFTDPHIFTREMFCSSLPDNDITGPCKLTTVYFNT